MDFVFELIIELLFEGSIEITKNKKISKWIRYPLSTIIILFFSLIILGLIILGIMFLLNNDIIVGILFIGLGIFFLVGSIYKLKKLYFW